jgi:hypothetical protein
MPRLLTKRILLQGIFLATACGLMVGTSALPSTSAQERVSFSNDIKPILESNCWSCHSEGMQLSKLDLSTREDVRPIERSHSGAL